MNPDYQDAIRQQRHDEDKEIAMNDLGEQLDRETETSLAALRFVDEKLGVSTAAEERIVHDIAANALARANAAEELADRARDYFRLGIHNGAALGDALTEWEEWR